MSNMDTRNVKIYNDLIINNKYDKIFFKENSIDYQINNYGNLGVFQNIVDFLDSYGIPVTAETLNFFINNKDILYYGSDANVKFRAVILIARENGRLDFNSIKRLYDLSIDVLRRLASDLVARNGSHLVGRNNDVPRVSEKTKVINPVIEKFLSDITSKGIGDNFRGWMLPNGQLLSEFVDKIPSSGMNATRQDHSLLFKIFMLGLEVYDEEAYNKINDMYQSYIGNGFYIDAGESFAVEVLGWMQIGHFGRKNIIYAGERYQDRLLTPFLVDYGYRYELSRNMTVGKDEFKELYDHINEIIELGLEEKYKKQLA